MAAPALPGITIFTRCYPPAYLNGGPARSLHGLVETLAAEFSFSVITSALDDPAAGPMESVVPDMWSTFGHARIWYELSGRGWARQAVILLRETRPQVVYLNSLFDYRFSMMPLLVTRVWLRRIPVLLAPRGELSAGALTLKRRKKRLFLMIFRLLRLHKTVTWHASTGLEQADIERAFGAGVRTHVAIDLRTGLSCETAGQDRADYATGTSGGRSLVFMSRIVPKKNVATLIRALPLVSERVRLSIAGPIEDVKYWDQCLALIGKVTDTDLDSVQYLGTVPAEFVVSFLSRFDLFVLPTLGENFGHVVLESLAAGTPVIVGHDTPWHQVEQAGAGWLCNPDDPGDVARLIQRFISLDKSARSRMRAAARLVATQVLDAPKGVAANRAMFQALTGRPGGPA
ncbi:MAG: glycosyltransferase [Streptosporangiaceae bacterium]|jgi:glycosyltransferase involved in cell wall biosynthesis